MSNKARGDGGAVHLLSERYERGSVLLTSNLPFSNGGIFKTDDHGGSHRPAGAHSVIVELNIPATEWKRPRRSRPGAGKQRGQLKRGSWPWK